MYIDVHVVSTTKEYIRRLIDSPMGNQRRVSSQDNLIDGRELETDYRNLSNDALKTSLIIIWIPPIKQSEVKHLL